MNLDWYWSSEEQRTWLLCAAEDQSIRLWCLDDTTQSACPYQTNTMHQSNNDVKNICKNDVISLSDYKLLTEEQTLCYKFKQNFDAVWLDNNSILIAAVTRCGTLKVIN